MFLLPKKGHFAKDCYKKKADQKKDPKPEAANSAEDPNAGSATATSEIASTVNTNASKKNVWLIDSGASKHMTPEKAKMSNYTKFSKPLPVKLADNNVLYAYGKGNLRFPVFDGTRKFNLFLEDVLYVPKILRNLLSLPTMTQRGAEVRFKEDVCIVISNEQTLHIGHKDGKLFKLNTEEVCVAYFATPRAPDNSVKLWHERFGHLGYDNLKLLNEKVMVEGLNLKANESFDRNCQGCLEGKQHRNPFRKKSQRRVPEILELIQSDVEVVNVDSVGGSKYYVTFTDDCSRFTTVYFLKNKSDVLTKFKEFVAVMENFTGKKVKILRLDNGGEYVSRDFKEFCATNGIIREETIPMSPQLNGVSERLNRTIMESARSMLHHAHIPLRFWAENVNSAVYLRNRSQTVALHCMTRFERFHDHKPDVSSLKVSGCNAHVPVPDIKRSKLEKKSVKCIFVGYPATCKGYKLYNIKEGKMLRSSIAEFLEDDFDRSSIEATKASDN